MSIPGYNGGTSTAYFNVLGPTAPRNYTFPDADSTIPDIFGTGAVGTWPISITGTSTGIAGVLGETHGGTGNSSYIFGDILYASATNTLSKLAGNITAAPLVLTSIGDGTNNLSISWQPLPVTGILVYYLTDTSAGIGADYKQTVTPLALTTTLTTASLTNGQLIYTWITDAGAPGRASLPAGQYANHIHAAKTAGSAALQIRAEIWETDSAGIDIAKIADLGPSTILTGSNAEYIIAENILEYTFASTSSRVATKLYAVVGATGSAPTIVVYMGGTSDSRTDLPSASVDATNFVPYTGATTNLNMGSYSITATGLNLTGLTASQAVVTDGSKNLASLAYTSSGTVSTLVYRDSSGNFSASTITAALNGNATTATSATTATTATNANNVATTSTATNASYFPLFVASSTNSNQPCNLGTGLTFNPSTNILSTTGLNLSGLTASQTVVTDGSKNLASLAYASANTASALVQRDGSGNFSAGTITAALSGNASTATTATNATNTAITDDTTTAATMYVTWVTSTTGNLPQKVSSSKLTFNPSTGTLTATTFSGAFSGTVTNATNIGITNDTTTNASMFPVWVTANTGNLPAKVSSTKLSFNPSTGLLNIASLTASYAVVTDSSKNLTSLQYTTTNTASALVQRDASSYMYSTGLRMTKNGSVTVPDFLVMGDTSQALNNKYWGNGPSGTSLLFFAADDALSANFNWLTVSRSGNTITSVNFPNGTVNITNTTNIATLTASQAVVTDGSKNLASLAYATANTASALVQRDASGNFSAGTITATLTGNASTATTATNATNTGITDDTTTNSAMNITWVTSNTGNLPQKVTSTKLTFNPSTGTLTSTNFSGSINTATESSDTTCFPVFVTASGTQSLPLKTNTGFTFNAVNSALGVGPLTASSLTIGSLLTAHVYARCEWDMSTASPTIRSSMNVSSISDNGVGKNGINMTNAMADANYTVLCFVRNEIAGGDMACNLEQGQTPTSSAFRMASGRAGTGFVDSVYANAIVVY